MVCRYGKVFKKQPERILKPISSGCGYYIVVLSDGKIRKTFFIHKLVLLAFVGPNPDGKPQINHKDENKHNNRLSNLEYCSVGYNVRYSSYKTNRHKGERRKKVVSRKKVVPRKKVVQKTLDGELVKVWSGAVEVFRTLGWRQSNISACCLGKIKTAYGYRWEHL